MTIYHDAYLFDPPRFVGAIAPLVYGLSHNADGYGTLRSVALSLYASHAQVRHLAAEYGGWDRASLIEQVPVYAAERQEDIAFWIVIMLYAQLESSAESLGLRTYWQQGRQTLPTLNWREDEVNLIVNGHSFSKLIPHVPALAPNVQAGAEQNYWDLIHPASTAGHAGWLAPEEIDMLLHRATRDTAAIHRPPEGVRTAPNPAPFADLARTMLQAAHVQNCGLCVISSG